jgi:hypothetical protein
MDPDRSLSRTAIRGQDDIFYKDISITNNQQLKGGVQLWC